MAAVNKLYSTKPHTSLNIGQVARIALKGTVNLIIYGSEVLPANVAAMVPCSDALTADSYYPLDTLPPYIAFVGTATTIMVDAAYELTDLGAIS